MRTSDLVDGMDAAFLQFHRPVTGERTARELLAEKESIEGECEQ
jgi:hypothetical protein